MSIRSMTVLTSPSQSEGTLQQPRADACVWIRKGCYVRVDSPDAFTTIWDSWATVAQARLLAVCVGAKRQAVFVGNSALVARSIPLWEANPDVVAWFGVRHGKRRLPPVRTMVATVPPVYVDHQKTHWKSSMGSDANLLSTRLCVWRVIQKL